MDHFSLSPRQTITFTMDKSNIYGRIYEEDGKELNYRTHSTVMKTANLKTWFWNIKLEKETGDKNF